MDTASSVIKNINYLLNSSKNRVQGFQVLSEYLLDCSDDIFTEYCVSWMQNCCKVDDSFHEKDLIITTLNKLFRISSHYCELYKPVSFFITNRFLDFFFKYLIKNSNGWSCAKTCFLFYNGPCGPSREALEKELFGELKKNIQISRDVSDCFSLLPSLGGTGNNGMHYYINWKNQFDKFLYLCHSVLNDLFADVEEIQEFETAGYKYSSEQEEPQVDYLIIQLYNHCSVLRSMLVNAYPVVKSISADLVLDLICRGLALNPKALQKNQSCKFAYLQNVLQDVHKILLELLNSLIVSCGNQLLPYSCIICKLIKQTLEWTHSNLAYSSEKKCRFLRISAYDNLSNWLVITKSGSSIDQISKFVIFQIVSDIELTKKTVSLKELRTHNKSESTTKQLNNRKIDESAHACLCYSALEALQYLIEFTGVLLKVEDHKFLQESVVKLLLIIQNSLPIDVLLPYSVSLCRKGLYSVLLKLINQACPKWPPPVHLGFRIFKSGINDSSVDVSQFCSSALSALTVITHQQHSNGPFLLSQERQSQTHKQSEMNELNWEREIENSGNVTIVEEEKSDEVDDKREAAEDEDNILKQDEKEELMDVDSEPFEESKIFKDENISVNENFISDSTITGVESIKELQKKDDSVENKNSEVNNMSLEASFINVSEINNERERDEGSQTIEKEALKPKYTSDVEEETTVVNDADADMEKAEVNQSLHRFSENEKNEPATPDIIEDGTNSEMKKRYFLRSKIKGSSEDPDDVSKSSESPESIKHTPVKDLGKNTPSSALNRSRRPRTRALCKLKTFDDEGSLKTPKRGSHDDDDDIIATFDESVLE